MKNIFNTIKKYWLQILLTIGSIATLFIVLLIKRSFAVNNFQSFEIKVLILCIIGIIVGLPYAIILSRIMKSILKLNDNEAFNKMLFIHLPVYLFWLYPFRIDTVVYGPINRILPIFVVLSIFIIGLITLLKKEHMDILILKIKSIKLLNTQFKLNVPIQKEKKLIIICSIVLIGFLFSYIYHYVFGLYLKNPYPMNTFLYNPLSKFSDFLNYFEGKTLETNPISNLIIKLFQSIGSANLALFAFLMIFATYFIGYVWNSIHTKNIHDKIINTTVLVFLSYPFLFSLDRANLHSYIFIFLSLFMLFFYKKKYTASIIFLLLATLMDIYSGVFIILFLSEKRYREFLILIISAVIYWISYLIIYSNALNYFINSIKAVDSKALDYGHSLFGIINLFSFSHYFINNIQVIKAGLIIQYLIIMFIVLILSLFYIVAIEKTFWKKITVLTFSILLFPFISYDFKLIYVYIPMLFFLNHEDTESNFLYTIVFALLIVPKNFHLVLKNYSEGAIINPLLMVILIASIVMQGIKNLKSDKLINGDK